QLPVRYCKKTNPATKDQQKQHQQEEGERQGGSAKEQQKEEKKEEKDSDKDYAETDDDDDDDGDNRDETASSLSAPFPSPPPQQLSSSPPPLSPVSLSVSAPVKKVFPFSLPPVSEIIQPQQSSAHYPDILPAESIESSAIENGVYMNVPAAVVHPFSAAAAAAATSSNDAREMMMMSAATFDYPTQHQYATVVTPPPQPAAALQVTPYHTVAQSAPGQGSDGFIYPIQFSDGTTAFHSTFSYQPAHHYHPIIPPQHRIPNPDAQPFQDDDDDPRHQSQSSTFNYSSEIEESLSTSFQRFF
ncbi:unnamed protein product, partial [Oikopleura dioica]